jgi:hypothetical protein
MKSILSAGAMALIFAAAASTAGAAAAAKKGEGAYDPDREICKSRPVVGSRVQRVRECHTAQQWEELKLAERAGLARQQYNGAQGQSASELYLPPRAGAPQQPN